MDKFAYIVASKEFNSSIKVGDRFRVRGTRNILVGADEVGTIEGVVAEHTIFANDNIVTTTAGTRIKLV